MNKPILINCEQITPSYEDGESALQPLNLTACSGDIISIIGPDHELTSCYLKTIAGILDAQSGQLLITSQNTLNFERDDWIETRKQFAYVHANTAVLSAANALQNLMLPAMYHKLGDAAAFRDKAEQLLKAIQAGENLERLPAYLTKEQRYKIAVARALMLSPKALLLDDSFSSLELTAIADFQQFLLQLTEQDNLLLLLTTHDKNFALKHSSQIIYASENKILVFDSKAAIENCAEPEVRHYLSL